MGWFRELFTVYSTTRVVQIQSKFLAITYVTLVALVWFAILKSYQLDLRKIYQKRCPVRGTFTTKVKGVLSTESYTNEDLNMTNPDLYRRIWDTQDLIIPGEAEFTVMTNIIITPGQTRTQCTSNSAFCTSDIDCPVGKSDPSKDGILTGYCFIPEGKCQVDAWCATEDDVLPLNGSAPLLSGTKNFTVLIKTSVEFPDCEPELTFPVKKYKPTYRRRNILSNFSSNYLTYCRYDPITAPFCPIFRLKDIVNWSRQNYDDVGITGGIFGIWVHWDCDFDWGNTIQDCLPVYKFVRIDVIEENSLAPGFNWRSAVFFENNRRTLTKYYGLKFVVKITGEGRKFDFLLLVLAIGASIGLFSLAPLFCDFLFDLFCYLKSLACCNRLFSESFKKEIRYQDIHPSKQQTQIQNRSSFLNRRERNSHFENNDRMEYSTPLSYDTKL